MNIRKIKIQTIILIILSAVLSANSFYGQVRKKSKKKASKPGAVKVVPADTADSEDKKLKKFVSKEGRFSIIPPEGFTEFKRNEFNSVSSWGDPLSVVQFFSYSVSTPAEFINNPQNYIVVMYIDYSATITKAGFDSELLEVTHKSTLRQFPEFKLIKTEREYWNTETGIRSRAERLDDTVFKGKPIFPLIRTFAQTPSGVQQVRMESYLINNRVYWLIASYDDQNGFGKSAAENFCQSFRLLSSS